MSAKRLQLLKEVIPGVSRVAFLWNPNNYSHVAYLEEWRVEGPTLGVKLLFVEVRNPDQFDSAFAAMMGERPDAFFMTADPSTDEVPDTCARFCKAPSRGTCR